MESVDFTVGYSRFIYVPGLHTDARGYCRRRYGGDLAHIDSIYELALVSHYLATIRNNGTRVASEIWIGGRTQKTPHSRVLMQDITYGLLCGDVCWKVLLIVIQC